MSINGTGTDDMDYSSFEYQQVSTRAAQSFDGVGQRNSWQVSFDPLDRLGGLDNNEVAELVYFKWQYDFEFEDEAGQQDRATSTEIRGTFGVNLAAAEFGGFLIGNASTTNEGAIETQGTRNESVAESKEDDAILDAFQFYAVPPFENATGNGGGNVTPGYYHEMNYRDITGRGPVLDQNDTLTLNTALIAGELQIDAAAQARFQLIWDVAETNDSGRRFSVPDGM